MLSRWDSLIDALLSFAKLSRQPLNKHRVDMDELVSDCLDYLHDDADAKLQITVHKLPPCDADRSLLKQVWQNLIDNALKYSRHRDPAIIEIGCTSTPKGEPQTYYAGDNGTGFDMTYAGKLFESSSTFIGLRILKEPALDWPPSSGFSIATAGGSGPKPNSTKAYTFYFTL